MMKQTTILILALIMMNIRCNAQESQTKTIEKNEMIVTWRFKNNRIYFKVSAPTDGWVTIGFNTHSGISGTYLLMGNVINNKTNLIEHFTKSPGSYTPISELGATPQVEDIEGFETSRTTQIKFSLPTSAFSAYQKDLSKGKNIQ